MSDNSSRRRVVVTGFGVVSPIGHSPEDLWKNVVEGNSGVGPITGFDASQHRVKIAAEVREFAPEEFLDRQDLKRTDRCTQFAIVAAQRALSHSGLVIGEDNAERIGVIVGTGQGGFGTLEEQARVLFERGPSRVSPTLVPMMIANMPSGYVSIVTGAKGPNTTVVTACATGAHAIGDAAEIIRRGAADAMLAGGTEAAITPLSVAAFGNSGAMCKAFADDPARASRPFDRDRAGFVMGEGAGVLVLESLEHALARNATIYGEIAGYGMTGDAYHMTSPEPSGEGVARAMRLAMESGGISPEQVGYVNAHATSTIVGDASEVHAIERAFGDLARQVPVSSTKGVTAHMLGAAGAVEAIIVLTALREGVLPPTINQENVDPEIELDIIRNVARPASVEYALSNNLGFGGHNASLLLRRM